MKLLTSVKTISIILPAVLLFVLSAKVMADDERDQKQAKLDAICEAAREKKLEPERKQLVEDCVKNKELRDRESCERFYSDFGARTATRGPLYYELPECVEAFEFLRS